MARIIGTDQNDSLEGTDSRDLIKGLAGDDTMMGFGGADQLLGGNGNDTLYAGEGMLGSSPNLLDGGRGNDFLAGGRGNDTLVGGAGDDAIWTSIVTPFLGTDSVDGGGGNDQITITGAAATARGGEGMDQFVVHSGDNVIDGTETGPWVDTVDYGDNSRRVVVNLVTGTAFNFQFGGGIGHDTLGDIEIVHGSAGADRLIGGNPLNDSLEAFRGGDGIDTIDGGSGHDVLEADNALAGFGVEVDLHLNRARDTFGNWDVVRHIEDVLGTEYDDVMIGNAADNTFYAAVADDQIDGRGGFDRVSYAGTFGPGFAGISLDLRAGTVTGLGTTSLADIEAATGTDLMDRLAGKGGKNALAGGEGDDRINGRDGDDSLSGDGGDDTLVGGQGADVFLFNIADGHDLVSDFSVGEDRLVILGYGFSNAAEVLSRAVQEGRNTVFSLADGSELILRQVQLSTLSDHDFQF